MNRKRRRDDPMCETYSVAEFGRIFGISDSTVRRRIDEEEIVIVEGLGNLKRIPKWVVKKMLKKPGDDSQ